MNPWIDFVIAIYLVGVTLSMFIQLEFLAWPDDSNKLFFLWTTSLTWPIWFSAGVLWIFFMIILILLLRLMGGIGPLWKDF